MNATRRRTGIRAVIAIAIIALAAACQATGGTDKAGGDTAVLRLATFEGQVNDNGQNYGPQAFVDNLRKLSGILLDAGANDDYNLHWGHRLLSHYLDQAGIKHEHRENSGNHGGRAMERFQMALEWLGQVLVHQGA